MTTNPSANPRNIIMGISRSPARAICARALGPIKPFAVRRFITMTPSVISMKAINWCAVSNAPSNAPPARSE